MKTSDKPLPVINETEPGPTPPTCRGTCDPAERARCQLRLRERGVVVDDDGLTVFSLLPETAADLRRAA